MLTCRWVRPRLLPFLLGELPGWQLRAVAAHAGRCPGCVHDLESLRQTLAEFTPGDAASAYLQERLLSRESR
jgi:Putative zinc-finger